VRLAGVLERAQMPWIRSGHRTMFLTLEDETELGQVVVFNDVYLKYGRVLKDAIYLLVDGELQNDEEHGLAVVAHQIMDLTKVLGRDEALPRRPGLRARRWLRLSAPRRLGAAGRRTAYPARPHRLTATTILAFHDVSGYTESNPPPEKVFT
jgi:DNA polymerase III alpha subunit